MSYPRNPNDRHRDPFGDGPGWYRGKTISGEETRQRDKGRKNADAQAKGAQTRSRNDVVGLASRLYLDRQAAAKGKALRPLSRKHQRMLDELKLLRVPRTG